MIISVHMPKSGGSSFLHLLKTKYPKSIRIDNGHPIHYSPAERHQRAELNNLRNSVYAKLTSGFDYLGCIHGHFMPYQYEVFYTSGNHLFVTWLRDPITRIESHYHFWKQHFNELAPLPLLKKFIREDWSLEKFAFREEIRDIYSIYLWKFPIERFDFIGVTEFFAEDIDFFAKEYLNIFQFEVPEKNVNRKKGNEKISDPGLIRELKEFHAKDYQLYQYALDQHDKRKSLMKRKQA